jgi:transcriptional regulator with AAA-type ATPase domain
MAKKNVYITWHYTTHGIAYLKHILSAFYRQKELSPEINVDDLDQYQLNEVFDNQKSEGFMFDEIIYLTAPQRTFDKISNRFDGKDKILEDKVILESGLKEIYEQIIRDDSICYNLEKEIKFVNENLSDKSEVFERNIWRNIHRYPIDVQIKWLRDLSNFKKYKNRFKEEKLNIDDLRNEKTIAENLNRRIKEITVNRDPDTRYIINVSLGSNETQVVWHVLMEAGVLPKNTRFIKTYDDKSKESEKGRFKLFSIKEISTRIISDIADIFKIYPNAISPSQNLENKKMSAFLKSGFAILLIGERGTGKSTIVENIAEQFKESGIIKGKLVPVNCASFTDNNLAESELFGHVKGAFTGANKDKDGLIKEAENGILFFDEVHNLSKAIQTKLMTALSTKKGNLPHVRKVGGKTEFEVKKVKLIFATNRSINELGECLLPDFYDRIVQHIIKIPPIRDDTRPEAKKEYWESTWKHLFGSIGPMPEIPNEKTDKKFMDWLQELPLYGNRRDLEKIAMYYNIYNQFDKENQKQEISAFEYTKRIFELYKSPPPEQTANEIEMRLNLFNTAFEYAKCELKKWESSQPEQAGNTVDIKHNLFKIAAEVHEDIGFYLQEWAIGKYGSRKEAANKLGVDEKTLYNWRNRTIS